jgi:Ethylbenzene dehydrogenase
MSRRARVIEGWSRLCGAALVLVSMVLVPVPVQAQVPKTVTIGAAPVGDVWKDGVRTIVFTRKLVTGSEYDVQFNDPKKEYAFGVAVFDNAQVRHAYVPGVLKLKFD